MSTGGPWDADPFYYVKLHEELETYQKKDEFKWHPNFGNIFTNIFTKFANPYAVAEAEYVLRQEIDKKISELPAGTEINVISIEAVGSSIEVSLEAQLPGTPFINVCMDNVRKGIERDVDQEVFAQCVIDNEACRPVEVVGQCVTMENAKVEFITRGVKEGDIITNSDGDVTINAGTGSTCSAGGDLILSPGTGGTGTGADMVITGVDMVIGERKSAVTIISPDGVTCKKCNDFNQYCTSPSELDGTHFCYKCRNGH